MELQEWVKEKVTYTLETLSSAFHHPLLLPESKLILLIFFPLLILVKAFILHVFYSGFLLVYFKFEKGSSLLFLCFKYKSLVRLGFDL